MKTLRQSLLADRGRARESERRAIRRPLSPGLRKFSIATSACRVVRVAGWLVVLALLWPATAVAQQPPAFARLAVEVEGGGVWATRNEARKPTDIGTTFSFLDLTGKGPEPFLRVAATFRLTERHAIRIVAAPVRTTGTGSFDRPVLFVDRTFDAGLPVEAVYEFNTYRAGYRYLLHQSEKWQVEIGATALVRDAKIQVEGAPGTATDTDLGLVPLAAFGLRRVLSDRASLVLDIEGLGASQGRAIDAAVKIETRLGDRWALQFGYRTIEGGADVESVYTFAWLHFGVGAIRVRF